MVDELHAHKKRDLWDVLDTGTGARDQPLLWAITTSGFDLDGICYEVRDYSEKVIRGVHIDDQFFAFVCEPEPEDDLDSVETMRKANPNLGVSVREEELRKMLNRARQSAPKLNNYLTKRMNRWVAQAERWISPDEYRALPTDHLNLIGQTCYAGMDLASTRDLTALVLAFPPHGERNEWALLPYFWCPETMIEEASQSRNLKYDHWERQGDLFSTGGKRHRLRCDPRVHQGRARHVVRHQRDRLRPLQGTADCDPAWERRVRNGADASRCAYNERARRRGGAVDSSRNRSTRRTTKCCAGASQTSRSKRTRGV